MMTMAEQTPFKFRVACEECHVRKIKCYPSASDHSGTCEPCRASSRRCLFSLKGKLGRPRNMSRNASNVSEARPQASLPLDTDQGSSESLPGTTFSSMTNTSSSDYQPPSQGGQDMLTERHLRDYNSSIMSGVVHGNSQVNIAQMTTEQTELMHIHHSYDDKTSPFDQFSGDDLESWYKYHSDDSHIQRTGLGSPYFQHPTESFSLSHSDFSKNESLPQHAEKLGSSGHQEHKSQHSSTYDKRDGGLPGILAIFSELQAQGIFLSQRRHSLMLNEDRDMVNTVMDTLRRASDEIASIRKANSTDMMQARSQTLTMVAFASIVQAVENISRFAELDGQNDSVTGSHSPGQLSSTSSTTNDGSDLVISLRLELIMTATRLDFFLGQIESFVSGFSSSVTVVIISHPSELIEKLQTLHFRIGLVLERLRRG